MFCGFTSVFGLSTVCMEVKREPYRARSLCGEKTTWEIGGLYFKLNNYMRLYSTSVLLVYDKCLIKIMLTEALEALEAWEVTK